MVCRRVVQRFCVQRGLVCVRGYFGLRNPLRRRPVLRGGHDPRALQAMSVASRLARAAARQAAEVESHGAAEAAETPATGPVEVCSPGRSDALAPRLWVDGVRDRLPPRPRNVEPPRVLFDESASSRDVLGESQQYNAELNRRVRERDRALPRPLKRGQHWFNSGSDDHLHRSF
jgi:hypothetical protein